MTHSNHVWQPIETAPKDGTAVDLWIVGDDDTVDFYSPGAKKIKGKPLRHGRATDFAWDHRPPNKPNWYQVGGLTGFPLSPEVRATHYLLPPPPPEDLSEGGGT